MRAYSKHLLLKYCKIFIQTLIFYVVVRIEDIFKKTKSRLNHILITDDVINFGPDNKLMTKSLKGVFNMTA